MDGYNQSRKLSIMFVSAWYGDIQLLCALLRLIRFIYYTMILKHAYSIR